MHFGTGGYFSTTGEDPSILLRLKEDYDGAEPTASSVALQNLLRLAALFPNEGYKSKADSALASFESRIRELPIALPQMAISGFLLDRWPLCQVVVLGQRSSPKTSGLLDAVHSQLVPDKAVIVIDPSDQDCVDFWRTKNPNATGVVGTLVHEPDCEPAVYVCQDFACLEPTSDPYKVKELLSREKGGAVLKTADIGAMLNPNPTQRA